MDLRKLKKLIDLVEQSGIAELEITEGEEKVRISRSGTIAAAPVTMNVQPAPPAHGGVSQISANTSSRFPSGSLKNSVRWPKA